MAVLETPKAQPASVGELFSNGRHYAVPAFQRDYAWTETAKRQAYGKSAFHLTRSLADREGWSPDALRARQETMAELAVRTWRIEDIDAD